MKSNETDLLFIKSINLIRKCLKCAYIHRDAPLKNEYIPLMNVRWKGKYMKCSSLDELRKARA